jgi:hypothetical protein
MSTSTVYPNGQVLQSSALTQQQMDTLVQQQTLAMLGYTAILSATPHPGAEGTDYQTGDQIAVVQPGAADGILLVTAAGGAVTSLAPVSPNNASGWLVGSNLATTGGSGTGLRVDVTLVGVSPTSSAVRIQFPVQGQPFGEATEDICYVRTAPRENEYDKIRYKFMVGQAETEPILQSSHGFLFDTGPTSYTIPEPVDPHSTLLVIALLTDAESTITLSDAQGDEFEQLVPSEAPLAPIVSVFLATDCVGGATMLEMSNMSPGLQAFLFVCEINSAVSAGALDGSLALSTDELTTDIAVTTTQPMDLVISMGFGAWFYGPPPVTLGPGATLIDQQTVGDSDEGEAFILQYANTLAPGTYDQSLTAGSEENMTTMILALAFTTIPAVVTELQNYTRTWTWHWTFYGPNATDHARMTKSALFQDYFTGTLALQQLFPVSDYPSPIRAPELVNGQWYDRSDYEAVAHEWVTETIIDQTVGSVEVIGYGESVETFDVTVQEA